MPARRFKLWGFDGIFYFSFLIHVMIIKNSGTINNMIINGFWILFWGLEPEYKKISTRPGESHFPFFASAASYTAFLLWSGLTKWEVLPLLLHPVDRAPSSGTFFNLIVFLLIGIGSYSPYFCMGLGGESAAVEGYFGSIWTIPTSSSRGETVFSWGEFFMLICSMIASSSWRWFWWFSLLRRARWSQCKWSSSSFLSRSNARRFEGAGWTGFILSTAYRWLRRGRGCNRGSHRGGVRGRGGCGRGWGFRWVWRIFIRWKVRCGYTP